MMNLTYISVVTIIMMLSFHGARVSSKQVFNVTCAPQTDGTDQDQTLETIATQVEENSNIEINLKVSQLRLTAKINFSNINTLFIIGEQTTITCNTSNSSSSSSGAGIVFSNITELLTLSNLKFRFCGSLFRYEFQHNQTYISALTIINCRNVNINRLIVVRSEGVGVMILNHISGHVNINSSVFKENKLLIQKPKYAEKLLEGGGGVYIHLGGFLTGTVYLPMTFQFNNCTFERNIGHTKYYGFHFTNILGEALKGYGTGGGAALTVRNGLSNVYVSFSACIFTSNQAFFGAGLSVRTYRKNTDKEMTNITVEIKDSIFQENGCSSVNHAYYGGGAYFSFSTLTHRSAIFNCNYVVSNTFFTKNCAELGGAVVHYSDHDLRAVNNNTNSSMVFDKCIFKQNKANIGSAIILSPNILQKLSSGYTDIIPTVKDCQFIKNSITRHKLKLPHSSQSIESDGVGTIYACQYSLKLEGCNLFESNFGTPIYIVEGVLNLRSSNVHFINNIGLHGGAIALIGSSRLIVGSYHYEFINNTAIFKGGALYILLVDIIDFTISRSCFIQYKDDNESVFLTDKWNSTISFTGNKAKDNHSGHAIYATSLHHCQVINKGNTSRDNFTTIDESKVFKVRGMTFDVNPSLQPQVSTDGSLLNSSIGSPLKIIPGQAYPHGVTVTDDIGQIVETSFIASISRNTTNITIESSYVNDKVRLRGEPNQTTSLFLETLSPRQIYVTLEVVLVECPPGFTLNHNKECVCNVEAYVGLLQCDLEKFHSHLKIGYWIGTLKSPDGYKLVTSPCPFCDYGNSISNVSDFLVALPQNYSHLSRTVCGETRTGIACGICREGYTVHFHSPGFLCKPAEPVGCKLGWLFYILSELVPVTVVFITVLVLNISFTSGAVNGFILFSQLLICFDIDASGIITYPDSVKNTMYEWTQAYEILYGLFNLEAFNSEHLSFCLWRSASALDMIAFKYVTILYSLLLIFAVVFIMKKCGGRCFGKCCRITTIKASVVHGLSTFLVLCYAQCVKVSIHLLISLSFNVQANSGFKPSVRVWLNGKLSYLGKEHLVYAVPAILCLSTVGLVPVAILISYPMLNKLVAFLGCDSLKFVALMSQKLKIINSLKPLLDSVQGSYKDNFRFFSGLYFLSRFLFQILIATKGFLGYYAGVGMCLLILLTMHSICQPDVKRSHNIIDTLLLTNLLLINLLSMFNLSKGRRLTDIHEEIFPAALQRVLIFLPLIFMTMYIIVSLCQRYLCKNRLFTFIASNVSESRKSKLKKLMQLINYDENNTDFDDEVSAVNRDSFASGSGVYYRPETFMISDTYP